MKHCVKPTTWTCGHRERSERIYCADLNLLAGPGVLRGIAGRKVVVNTGGKKGTKEKILPRYLLAIVEKTRVNSIGMFIPQEKFQAQANIKVSAQRGGGEVDEGVNCQHLETRQLEEPQTKEASRQQRPPTIFSSFFFERTTFRKG